MTASVAVPAAAGPMGGASASTPSETLTVTPGTGPDAPVVTRTQFVRGRSYSVVVRGQMTRSTVDSGGNPFSMTFDAVYCFAGTGNICSEPPGCCTHTLQARDESEPIYNGLSYFGKPLEPRSDYPDNPAYQTSHVYRWLIDEATGPLRLYAGSPDPGYTYSGGFNVEIYTRSPGTGPVRVAFDVDALRKREGHRASVHGSGVVRGPRDALKPPRAVRIRYATLDGAHYTLRVTKGTFKEGRPDLLVLTTKVERSDNPKCPVGKRWFVTIRDFKDPAGPGRTSRDRVSVVGCEAYPHIYSAPNGDAVDLALRVTDLTG